MINNDIINSFIKNFIEDQLTNIHIGTNKIVSPIKNMEIPSIENRRGPQFNFIIYSLIQFSSQYKLKFEVIEKLFQIITKYIKEIKDQNNPMNLV